MSGIGARPGRRQAVRRRAIAQELQRHRAARTRLYRQLNGVAHRIAMRQARIHLLRRQLHFQRLNQQRIRQQRIRQRRQAMHA
jgi:hypothetical protein